MFPIQVILKFGEAGQRGLAAGPPTDAVTVEWMLMRGRRQGLPAFEIQAIGAPWLQAVGGLWWGGGTLVV